MTQKKHVTYEMFLEVVEEMVADGIVPTVRKIVEKSGGSNTTIQGYWHQWLQSLLAANRVGHDTLSRRLLDTIVAEMDTYAAQVVETVHGRLKAALEKLSETEEEKSQAEASAEALRQELDALQQGTATRIKALESELEQATGRAAAHKESAQELQGERDRALRQEREAVEAAARSRQEAETAVAEAKRAEARLAELDREAGALRERLAQAEKLAAVAEERARQLEAMVVDQRTRIESLADAERRAITAEAKLSAPLPGGKKGNGGGSRGVQPELGL